jgi:hypothetical protein
LRHFFEQPLREKMTEGIDMAHGAVLLMTRSSSLPGLTGNPLLLRKKMDAALVRKSDKSDLCDQVGA